MKKILLLISAALLFACGKEKEHAFLISKDQIGFLTKEAQVRQLDSIFEGDSIVAKTSRSLFEGQNQITIYDKEGNALLLLDPVQDFDSTSTIGNIRILDSRYKTKSGLGIQSSFKDILANHSISRIENTLDAAVVFIDEINAYVTFDKTSLPEKFRNNTNADIKASDIPEGATIEYFWIGWK